MLRCIIPQTQTGTKQLQQMQRFVYHNLIGGFAVRASCAVFQTGEGRV